MSLSVCLIPVICVYFYRILRGRIIELKNMCMFDFVVVVFIFGCCWVFVAVHGFSLVVLSRHYCLLGCAGSVQWLLLSWSTSSRGHQLQ